jgi:uncharacterized protein involved in copper resistance
MRKPSPPLAESLAKSFAASLIILAVLMIFALLASAIAQPAPAAAQPPDAAPVTAPPDATPPMPPPANSASPSHAHAARLPDKPGPAKFPSAIAANYAKDAAGKGRRETCLDQYKANKSTGANGGLKWIQKGGGYFSACSRKLKG